MAELVIVQPNGPDQVVGFYRHQYPCINTAPIRIECLQPIDGRQIEAGIGEGHQLPVDQIPVAFGLCHGIFRQFDGVLCSGIGQWIIGAGGQYAALRNFQGRESGRQMVEPAPSGSGFDADGPGAEPVKIPESLFQGSVNKKPEMVVVIFYAFTPSGKVPLRS